MAQNLTRSSLVFSFMTLISRIAGFVRDMVAAALFGASPGFDAFLLAFRLPNLMRRLFAEGAFSQAFVPVLADVKATQSEVQLKQFINRVCGNLSLCLSLVCGLGMLGAPVLVKLFAPGFTPGDPRSSLACQMLWLTMPYLLFISLTALAGAVQHAAGRFAAPAFTPVLLNGCLISASVLLASHCSPPEMALAWGVLLAGVMQCAFQLPFLAHLGLTPRPCLNWSDPNVRQVLRLMLPALFGAAIGQINIMVDTLFASFLPQGSLAWLYYADRLMEFPLGLFGVGLATVVLPSLSKQHAQASEVEFSRILNWALRCVLLISVPAAVGLFCLAEPLLATLFQSGRFGEHDVLMSSQTLQCYALAVLGLMGCKVWSSAFFARKNIKAPVKISAFILGVNGVGNALLIGPLQHAGLALATSIAALVNGILLAATYHRQYGIKWQPGWGLFMLRLLVATAAMALLLQQLTPVQAFWLTAARADKIAWLSGCVAAGGATYLGCLVLTGFKWREYMLKVA